MELRAEGVRGQAGEEDLLRYCPFHLEELAQTISNKKYLFKAIDNQKQIEEKFDRHKSSKATIIATNIEKSIERKHRLLSDKVKVYQTNDKRWFSKKEQIR